MAFGREDIGIDIEVTGDDAAARDLNKVGDSARGLGGRFEGMGGRAKAAGAAVALAAATMAVDVGVQLANMGLELDLMGKRVDTVFGDQAADINAWAAEVNRSMGTSAQRVAGLTANVGDLLIPLGFTREQAAAMSMDVLDTASALDLWSTSTNSVEEATEILNAALLGERERLKGLGISLTQAELDAALLTRGLGDLEGQERKLAEATVTLELIQQKSSDAMAFASSEGAEQQLVVRDLQARWAELRDSLAEKFLPIAITVGEKLLELADWIGTNVVPAVREWWEEMEPLRNAVAELIEWMVPLIGKAIELQVFIATQLIGAIGSVVGALQDWWHAIEPVRSAIADIIGWIADFVGRLGDIESAVRGRIVGAFETMAGVVQPVIDAIRTLIDWIGRIPDVGSIVGGIGGAIGDAAGAVADFVPRPGNWVPWEGSVPFFAQGGVVPARTGGTPIIAGEAGEDEVILPASRLAGLLGRGAHAAEPMAMAGYGAPPAATTLIIAPTIHAGMGTNGPELAAEIIEHIRMYERRNGAGWRAAAA